jgi:hypothetical protein
MWRRGTECGRPVTIPLGRTFCVSSGPGRTDRPRAQIGGNSETHSYRGRGRDHGCVRRRRPVGGRRQEAPCGSTTTTEVVTTTTEATTTTTEVPPEGEPECEPSYPDLCIPPGLPDIDCGDIPEFTDFPVLPPEPHGFDGDNDGIGCESGGEAPPPPAAPPAQPVTEEPDFTG